jgi:hypothetical protein
MPWNLFIDDERNPSDVFWADSSTLSRYHEEDWVIVRSYHDAILEVLNRGFPSFISFDHDLGENSKSGFDVAKVLVDNDIISGDTESRKAYKFPENFAFFVHSQNPIGKKNIEELLNSYLRFRQQ